MIPKLLYLGSRKTLVLFPEDYFRRTEGIEKLVTHGKIQDFSEGAGSKQVSGLR